MYDWIFNVNGSTYESAFGDSLPNRFDSDNFNWNTGIGTLGIYFSPGSSGTYSILGLFDHEITEPDNTFFNEYAYLSGSPEAGQSYEADEPAIWGDIYFNLLDGTWDNTIGVSKSKPDDVAMAMGWEFDLAANESARIAFILGSTVPNANFFLTHTDPDSGDTIFFYSTFQKIIADPAPEPGTMPLTAFGLIFASLFGLKKRKNRRIHFVKSRILSFFYCTVVISLLAFSGFWITTAKAGIIIDPGPDQSVCKDFQLAGHIAVNPDYTPPGNDTVNHLWFGPFATTDQPDPLVVIPEGRYTVSHFINTGTALYDITTSLIEVKPCLQIDARAKRGKVQLTWPPVPGMTRYDVYKTDEASPGQFEKIAETVSDYATYLDTNVENEKTYLYLVGALVNGNWSYPNVISAHPTAIRSRTPVNYSPLIYSSPITNGTVGILYNYDVNAADPNKDTLTYTLVSSPAGMTIAQSKGIISWTPGAVGTYPVQVRVTDGQGGSHTQSFAITTQKMPVPVQVSLSADPVSIDQAGGNITLSWTSSYAESVSIDNGVGPVDLNGGTTLFLTEPKTFTITAIGPGGTETDTVSIYLKPSVSLEVDPQSILKGDSASLTWTSAQADTVTIEPGIDTVSSSGTVQVSPDTTTPYKITATGPGGTAEAQVVLAVVEPPEASINVVPQTIKQGEAATLSWNTANAGSVNIDPDIGSVVSSGKLSVSPAVTTTYKITASGPGGTTTSRTTVTVLPAPVIDFSAAPLKISPGGTSQLTWSCQHADTVTIDNGIGPVNAAGSLDVSPSDTTTYKITAIGPGGTKTMQAVITVVPLPTVSLSVDPASVTAGESAVLTWSSNDADTVSIDNGIGAVDLNGSLTVSPAATTTYTITATGFSGTATAQATVTVTIPEPTVSFSADPQTIQPGESSTLTWRSTNADTLEIDQGIGTVAANGSITVSPAQTTTYAITASGPGGQATLTITIEVVYPPPVMNISADPGSIIQGESAVLSWTATYTDAVTITPDIGTVAANGSVSVTPDETTTYTFTATGPGGTNAFDVTITVTPKPTDVTAQGTVRDTLTGLPLAGATVSYTDSAQTHTMVSDSDGNYTVAGIAIGPADIKVELKGYITYESRTTFSNPGTWEFDFDLVDVSFRSSVQGTVFNSKTLAPEPGVTVSLEGSQNLAVTGQDGTYVLNDVPYGSQTLRIYKEDIQDTTLTIPVGINPFQLDLAVPYGVSQTTPEQILADSTGIITDGMTGMPVPGAKISVISTSVEATAGPDGQAHLSNLPDGNNLLLVTALNHEAVLAFPEIVSDGSDTFSVSLSPAAFGTIIGIAADAVTGDPVHLTGISIGKGSLAGAQTEPDGTYKMRTVPAGTYTVTASHPAYETGEQTDIVVQEGETATVDFALTPRPQTGSLEGVIRDKDSHDPISGAVISHPDTGFSTTTDANGYYRLEDLPAGMAMLLIQASGYPDAERRYTVDADENTTPTVTAFDTDLSLTDPAAPETTSVLVTALEGGNIETPDKRFQVVIPPHSLSADAIVTVMPASTGPVVTGGDSLILDPKLGDHTVTALGQSVQIALEPAVQGDPVPTLESWVVLAGRYSQNTVDTLGLDEQTVFPYYWDGTNWTALQIKPFEAAVDEVNNRHLAVVNFSETQAGDPVVADLDTKSPVLLASIDDYLPDLGIARIYRFSLAAIRLIDRIHLPTNAYVYDKGELSQVPVDENDPAFPNANGLPLLMFHGWDPLFWENHDRTDPNVETRYQYLVEDMVTATNGVYRPMFGTYNSRSSIVYTGNDLANAYEALGIKGLPGDSAGSSGEFPFIDTFGFSMGGLVSRVFQEHHQGVHQMIMAGTPNHGTHYIVKKLDELSNGTLKNLTELITPGTADLAPYDDSGWFGWLSSNPTLYNLNRSAACMPSGDITLVAGDKGFENPLLDTLLGPSDMVVPVDSVFCRTTDASDGNNSLLKVHPGNKITEVTDTFTHLGFSTDEYRISQHEKVYIPIQQGLSDWVVGKSLTANVVKYNDFFTVASADYDVEVQYNVWNNTYDRVVLAVYAMDTDNNWHVMGDYVDESGNVTDSELIKENSKTRIEPLKLQTSVNFAQEDNIWQVRCELKTLKPGQTKVSLTPSANFELP